MQRQGRRPAVFVLVLVIACALCACASDPAQFTVDRSATTSTSASSGRSTSTLDGTDATAGSASSAEPGTVDRPGPSGAVVRVGPRSAARPLDARLLGTNVPAWIPRQQLADPAFREEVVDLGATLARMPGGSWSSSYDWLGCETEDSSRCVFTNPLRPSDYVDFLAATGLEGMWTVSINSTAQEAAALVAFFNGSQGDSRAIGVDRNGVDWKTVGAWADLRARGGHPDPQPLELWEVGNEVYGAKPAVAGSACFQYGWEDAWTCDGSTYVHGDDRHDGYAAVRAAMLAVDDTIAVGAVGIGGDQSEWSDFGNEVIEGTAGALDFYVVHDYGFGADAPPDDILRRPVEWWEGSMKAVTAALGAANDAPVPVAVTEYNMFLNQDNDTEGRMAEGISAVYIADTIGQMAANGVTIANQWDLINGVTPSGADYGIFDATTGDANPQYWALEFWSEVGDELLPTTIDVDPASLLSAYAGRRADGTATLLLLNKGDAELDVAIRFDGRAPSSATGRAAIASSWDAPDLQMQDLGVTSTAGGLASTLPARSMSLIEAPATS